MSRREIESAKNLADMSVTGSAAPMNAVAEITRTTGDAYRTESEEAKEMNEGLRDNTNEALKIIGEISSNPDISEEGKIKIADKVSDIHKRRMEQGDKELERGHERKKTLLEILKWIAMGIVVLLAGLNKGKHSERNRFGRNKKGMI